MNVTLGEPTRRRRRVVRVPRDYYRRVHETRYRNILGSGAEYRQKRMQPHVAEAWERFRSTVTLPPGALGIEFGSGTGINAITIGRQRFRMMGMGISQTAVREARELARGRACPVPFFVGDMFAPALRAEVFDFAVDVWTLHVVGEQHLRDQYLSQCHRVLKAGGYLFLHSERSEDDVLVPGEEMVIEETDEWNIPEHKHSYDLPDGGKVEVSFPDHHPPGLCGRRSLREHREELERAGLEVLECRGDVMQSVPSVPGNPVMIAFCRRPCCGST